MKKALKLSEVQITDETFEELLGKLAKTSKAPNDILIEEVQNIHPVMYQPYPASSTLQIWLTKNT